MAPLGSITEEHLDKVFGTNVKGMAAPTPRGRVSALLYGPPGTGKTSLVEVAFPDLIAVAGDGDTTAPPS